MDHGYDAVLRGDTLEWTGARPAELEQTKPIPVHVLLREETQTIAEEERKRQLGEALDALVKLNPFREIDDPVAWQREMRVDRPLPGREE